MTTEEFNALPEEARRFISSHAGCLGCGGNKEQKLNKAYQLYLNYRVMKAYQLFGGGINYKEGEERGVLYPLSENDTDFQIREKIRIAKLIREKSPEVFISFNERDMEEILENLEEEEVIEITELNSDELIEEEEKEDFVNIEDLAESPEAPKRGIPSKK